MTVPARREEDASLRPVPWRRMAWVAWRQHRLALAGVAALLGALAVYVWTVGLGLHHAYAAATACHPSSSMACSLLVSRFNGIGKVLWYGYVLQLVPPLVGAFVGAPVLARELETGTFRYAWTQGFGGWRWALAKLVPLAVAVAAAAGALSALISWYYQPYFATGNRPFPFPRRPRSLPACSTCGGSHSLPGRWQPSPSVAWPAWPSAGSSPPLSPPWSSTPGSPPRRGCTCASTTWRRVSPATPIHGSRPAPRGSSANSGPPKAASPSASPCLVRSFREHHHSWPGKAGSRRTPARSSTSSSTGTRCGPPTSRPAGSGPFSSSKQDGFSHSPFF